jgi:uncharacterized protein (TIGR02391 family)
MSSLKESVPEPEILLALEPEELAGYLMEYLNSLSERDQESLNRYNMVRSASLRDFPDKDREEISKALVEAWMWLEREGLLAPQPSQPSGDWYYVTRRGKRIKGHTDLEALRNANLLPQRLLHPAIGQKVWATFLRGDYDTAVFQVFKEVEVAVRTAGKYAATEIGVDLMRKAFRKSTGPLTDTSQPVPEQENLMHLFAGAIGYYKNPRSHRHVSITDPTEAVEMIILASHLLKIVDSRTT